MWRYVWVAVLAVFAMAVQANEIKADHRHTLLTLLTSDNPADWQTAEEVVRLQRYTDQYALDVMAERLHSTLAREHEKAYFVPLARFARALGESGQVRFRPLLNDVLARSANKKLHSYLKNALRDLPKTDAPAYVPGQLDWVALQQTLEAITVADQQLATTRQRVIPAIGTSMDAVYASLGLPDHVKALTIPHTRLGNIKAFYYGLGIIQFDYADRNETVLTVTEVMPESSPLAQQYQGPNKALAHAFNSAHDKYMRYLIKGGWRTLQTDPALLPVVYDKLVQMAPTDNKYGVAAVAEAMSYLFRIRADGFDTLLGNIIARAPESEAAEAARKWQARLNLGRPVNEDIPAEADEPADIVEA